MESLTEKEFEEKLYNYLRRNNRTHFTTQSLTNRLKEIVADPELIEYGRKNAQNILNKMEEEGKIYVEEIAKKIYYSVDFPESGYQKKPKFGRESTVTFGAGTIVLIIGAIVGGIVGAILWNNIGRPEDWWYIFAGMGIGAFVLFVLYDECIGV